MTDLLRDLKFLFQIGHERNEPAGQNRNKDGSNQARPQTGEANHVLNRSAPKFIPATRAKQSDSRTDALPPWISGQFIVASNRKNHGHMHGYADGQMRVCRAVSDVLGWAEYV